MSGAAGRGTPLPPFRLERWFARHEFSARHLLCASDCETLAVEELLAMEPGAEEAFLRLRLGYTESRDPRPCARSFSASDSRVTFVSAANGPS